METTDGAPAAVRSWQAQRVQRTCPVCGAVVEVIPSKDDDWQACSRLCKGILRRRGVGGNRLQRRCFEHISANKLTYNAFADAAGINRTTFRTWLKSTTGTLKGPTLAAIAGALGISEEQAVREIGGHTAEERQAELARRNIQAGLLAAGQSAESHRKAGAASRGVRKSAAHREAIRQAHRANAENRQRAAARLTGWHDQVEGAFVQRLLSLLGNHKKAGTTPTTDQIRQHAERTAAALGTRAEVVMRAWRPYLQQRDMAAKDTGGPKLLEKRHQLLEMHMHRLGLERGTRKPRGFWDEAAKYVTERDPNYPVDGPALQAWYKLHLGRCPRSYFAPSGA